MERQKGQHTGGYRAPPIIDDETFEQAPQLPAAKNAKSRPRPQSSLPSYPLRGLDQQDTGPQTNDSLLIICVSLRHGAGEGVQDLRQYPDVERFRRDRSAELCGLQTNLLISSDAIAVLLPAPADCTCRGATSPRWWRSMHCPATHASQETAFFQLLAPMKPLATADRARLRPVPRGRSRGRWWSTHR